MGVDIVGLGLTPDEVAVAPGLHRIEHEHAVPSADERPFEILPEVAGGLEPDHTLRGRRTSRRQRLKQGGDALLGGGDGEALADGFPIAVQHGDAMVAQRDVDTDKPLWHSTPFEGRRDTARISRTGATHRKVRMAWSIVRDDGKPSPSILDECSRPGGRGATLSLDGSTRRSPEVRRHQSSSPSCLRTDLNRTLLLATRGITTTSAGASRS